MLPAARPAAVLRKVRRVVLAGRMWLTFGEYTS